MSADGIEIRRRLTQEDPADADLYRGIRLEALQANAEAFASTFLEYGVEKNALKQDGRYYDEVLMAKDLLG